MNALNASLRRRRGVSVVLFAIILVVLIGLIGLMIDTSYVFLVGHQLQNAADAAALAGARQVYTGNSGDAVTAAVAAAGDNKVDGSLLTIANGDVQTGNYTLSTSTFTSGGAPYNAVHVTARRTSGSPSGSVNLIFGPIFAVNASNVSRQATAMFRGSFAAGIIALDPSRSSSFGSNGNVAVTVNNGGIQVNSSSGSAVTVKGSAANISATELRVQGGVSTTGQPTLPSQIDYGATPVADPLANLPAPTKGTDLGSVSNKGNKTVTLNAGYYSGGVSANNGTVYLNPGVYIFGPTGLNITGNANLEMSGNVGDGSGGVVFYLTTGSGSSYGMLNLGGTGTIAVNAPTTGTYKNVLVFQDRNTPYSAGSDSIGGTGTLNITGVIYTPSVNFSASGTSNNFASQIIADTVAFSGNSSLTINYNGFNATLNEVFLVQ